jgi:hypothetical protein
MSCKHPAARHHHDAAHHYQKAADHHREAERYFEAQDLATAACHAHLATGHRDQADDCAAEASKVHARHHKS